MKHDAIYTPGIKTVNELAEEKWPDSNSEEKGRSEAVEERRWYACIATMTEPIISSDNILSKHKNVHNNL